MKIFWQISEIDSEFLSGSKILMPSYQNFSSFESDAETTVT